jgi:hypothetical protein
MATEGFEGEGLEFYRCTMCSSVVSVWDIKEHGGCKVCKNSRIRPTELSLWEKIKQIFLHPKLWEWKDQSMEAVKDE